LIVEETATSAIKAIMIITKKPIKWTISHQAHYKITWKKSTNLKPK
jgi:hypothetical protein